MPFTAEELGNIANASLDWYMDKGRVNLQSIQVKPLYDAFDGSAKTFPGGKGNISLAVKGDYASSLQGYSTDDTVNYVNPAKIKRVAYPWREHHIGITLTLTELHTDGISVVDSLNSESTTNHSDREMHALCNLLQDKLEDMSEGYERGMNNLLWGDGTADPKALAGIGSLIIDVPAVGTTGGLNRATFPWWRNRSAIGIVSNTANGGALLQKMQTELRQLRRYVSGSNILWLAGSDWINAMEIELRANGNYTMTGFNSAKTTDGGMADLSFKGLDIVYDPTLDDLGKAKYAYLIDKTNIFLMYMQGERQKKHAPARPAEKYVMYRALTTVGGLVARRLNSSGVYSIA
jgi:hypothetical protein